MKEEIKKKTLVNYFICKYNELKKRRFHQTVRCTSQWSTTQTSIDLNRKRDAA